MKHIALPTLLLVLGLASPALAQGFNLGEPVSRRPDAPPPVRMASNLGGGFIEFLVTGGDMAPEAEPQPRAMRRAYGSPRPQRSAYAARGAYALPPSAGEPVPQRPRMAPVFEPAMVEFSGTQRPGTVVIDTSERFLYFVMEGGKAMRYGVGVGRPGFEWRGTKHITRKAEWPDWRPPAEMRRRRPDLPVHMAGGPHNPLGARALYLGSSLYRIHGSNEPHTIGQAVSSGCIRMRNEDVIDLYERVGVGTAVVVL